MSTAVHPALAPAPVASGIAPPEQRGTTTIADRVVERIAARAAIEVDQVGGTVRTLLGVPLGRNAGQAAAQASALVDGHLAVVQLSVTVVYPAPVRQVARRLRAHVAARIAALTGLEVRQVDIEVTALVPPARRGRVS